MTVATILTQNADLTLFPQQYIAPSLLWDPRPGHPFIYLTCPESYPNPSYLLKFNRQTLTMTLQVNETHDVWSSLGVPDIDLQGRLYWSAPGGLTHASQKIGRYSGDTLALLETAKEGGEDALRVSGTFRVDRRSSHKFWWQRQNGSLSHGGVTCFRQSDMQHVYSVSQENYGMEVGFSSGPRATPDMDCNADGVLWVVADWPINPEGGELRLFRTGITGATTLVTDLSALIQGLFGGAGTETVSARGLKWVARDNTLVLYVPPYLLKLSMTGTVLGTLDTGGGLGQQSFHHTDDDARPFIWLGRTYIDEDIDTPNGYHVFPEFVEIDLVHLSIARTFRAPEIGVYYPFESFIGPIAGANFANPQSCLWDPSTNCLTTDDRGFVTICHYCVGPSGPEEPPVIITPAGIVPLCPPLGVTLLTTHTKSVLFPTELF
jgi:hypothetical protein